MKQAVKLPSMSATVSPSMTMFEVSMPEADRFGWDTTFRFSVDSDGIVKLNDNVFNSKAEAVKVLEAMTSFLKK
jgi:hypothetical protein